MPTLSSVRNRAEPAETPAPAINSCMEAHSTFPLVPVEGENRAPDRASKVVAPSSIGVQTALGTHTEDARVGGSPHLQPCLPEIRNHLPTGRWGN